MKTIVVPEIELNEAFTGEQVRAALRAGGGEAAIDTVNWAEYPYKPSVTMHIAHTAKVLWCCFDVEGDYATAVNLEPNSSVWEDSCVEIFLADADGRHYYNFENNCIGTGLAARRLSRSQFERLPVEKVLQVKRLSTLPHQPVQASEPVAWSMAVGIPFALIGYNEVPRQLRANFYKCGDKTRIPHFLSWSPIGTPKPDFHQPSYFGTLFME